MVMRLARLIVFLALMVPCGQALAVEAHLELPESIPPNVTVSVMLVVAGDSSMTSFHLPSVPGLQFSHHVIQREVQIINGDRQEKVGIELRAAALGDYLIPAFTVDLEDGSTVQTAPGVLHVKAGDDHLQGTAVAEGSFDPPTIVPGQPTKLIYGLSILRGARPLDVSFGPPSDAIKLSPNPKEVDSATLDSQGRQWQVYTLTWTLTFNAPGEHTVVGDQPFIVSEDFFDQRRDSVAVKPAHLVVAEVPTAGRPADFSGLIGPLALDASLAHEQVTTDQGTVLSLVASGPQALQMHAPAWSAPAGLRAYALDPVDEDGKRTFRWDLTAAASGTFTIPPFDLPYFEPTSRTFGRAQTHALTLQVAPGSRVIPSAPAATAEPTPTAPAALDLVPMRLRAWPAPQPHQLPWIFAAALLIGLVAGRAPRAWRRLQSREHAGRDLRRALAARDLDGASQALARLRPRLSDPALVHAAEQLRVELDLARYGGRELAPAATAWAAALERS